MLEIKDLHVYYGAIHALKGISLTVGDGELGLSDRRQRRRENHHAAYHLRPAAGLLRLRHAGREGSSGGACQYHHPSGPCPMYRRAVTSLPR